MKVAKRNKVLLTLALGAAMAVSVGVMQIDSGNVSVSAITVDETTKVASDGFVMKAGASVRYKDNNDDGTNDEAGIRWTTEVSSDFTTWLSDTYKDASVEYRTLITAVNLPDRAAAVSVSDLTVEHAEELLCNDTKGTLSGGEYYGSVLYKDDTVEGWATLTDAQLCVIYEAELIARSYVKVTPTSGDPVIIYAQAEDTARSMRAVANAALMKGENSLLNKYIGTAETQEERAGLYDPETDNGSIALNVNELGDGTYVAYMGAKLVGDVTVANNTVTLSMENVADGEHTLSLFNESADVYRAPFIKATKVLKDVDDLAMFDLNNTYAGDVNNVTTVFDGYYILGNDIDASENGYTHKSIGYTSYNATYANVGLTGTFNGDGHKIFNLTFAGNASGYNDEGTSTNNYKYMDYSLFGVVCGGTIKNVGIVNASYGVVSGVNSADKSVLANLMYGANLENVYIQLNGLSYGLGSFWSPSSGVAYLIDENTTMKNCIFDIYDDGTIQEYADKAANLDTPTVFYDGAGFGALSGDGGKSVNGALNDVSGRDWTNVFVVSPLALSHEGSGENHYEFFGANLNKTASATANYVRNYAEVTQYLSHEDMVAANIDYETLGFTAEKGWKIVDGHVPTWNGVALFSKTVDYTVNLDDEKTQLSEDDLYALFGDTSATLVSAITSDSTYGISYAGGALSVTGAAWNGETFTATFSDGNWNVTATVRLCTEVITTAEELNETLNLGIGYPKNVAEDGTVSSMTNPGNNANLNRAVNGYYVLDNDIDASGYKYSTHGYISSTWNDQKLLAQGFTGTFDGCGYTVSNITFGETNESEVYTQPAGTTETGGNILYKSYNYSIFGVINSGATVKNVAFTDVNYSSIPSAATKASVATLAMWINGATIENVYVSVDCLNGNVNSSRCGLAYGIFSSTTMNNVVVEIQDVTATDTLVNFGSISSRLPASDFVASENWTNVYVLSDRRLVGSSGGVTTADTYSTDVDAGNIAAIDESAKYYRFANVYRYADADAWKTAQESDTTKNDFTSFDGVACWDMTTGVPVWKN